MAKMITGKTAIGETVVYDLPSEIKTAEQFKSLIYGYNENQAHRVELQGQPLLLGLNGPMFNGYGALKSTGEQVVIIRYEKPSKY